ncbi:hypothetical protein AAC387_Pa05g1218 [Persea americana]|eukprot:TRINITY_DN16232_c0_g1_i1.p1 TRINITY_DN16232_c0_g1~~TRINITY_DN16232_c0_g1_i1.p1  ORF type:complete len:447 (+),score=65.95 TRINITY_DN16232_c0_g1_i1:245-1585(+)
MRSRRTTPEEGLSRAATLGSSPPAPPPQAGRRKATGTKTWLVVSLSGHSHHEDVGKHSIMRRTGLPARDLRVLDPVLSYPSTILGREKAIVVNLEHIKSIVTATEALVLNSMDPMVAPFVQDLQFQISNFHRTPKPAAEGSDIDMEVMNQAAESPSTFDIPQQFPVGSELSVAIPEMKDGSPRPKLNEPKYGSPRVLPFEFRVLEVCLESACRCLESETCMLEKEAYPALDELTSKISTLNLERVRQIKSRLVTISGRVQKVRDELEHLLDDDMDMAEMYLTDKLAQQSEETSSRDELDNNAFELDDERDEDSKSKARRSYESSSGFKPNIEELEMLLEAYFTQVGGTLNKLSTLREYVDDTEDYINIMLDDKQNQLLQMGVMLSTATLVLNAGIVVAGVFGMNIHINLFESSQLQFSETVIGTIVSCFVLYIFAIGWGKKRGLLG